MKRTFLIISLLAANYSLWAIEPEKDSTAVNLDSSLFLQDDPVFSSLDSFLMAPYANLIGNHIDSAAWYAKGYREDSLPQLSAEQYRERVNQLNMQSPVEMVYNEKVQAFINLYAYKRRQLTSKVLGLQDLYFPMIEEVLDRYQLPQELKYLAVVESALNPKARSRAGAMGLWQFMYATGKMYGLHQNSYMDERMDPIKSTEAACQYLSYLHKMYGRWDLALAAYNCGPGNVNRAMRRAGKRGGYWEIYDFLPRETRGYVPAFIAVAYVMNHYEDHALVPITPQNIYYETDTIHVTSPVSFEYLSTRLNISIEELQYLNPSYTKNYIPAYNNKSSILRLPHNLLNTFVSHEEKIYAENKPIGSPQEAESMQVSKPSFQEDRLTHKVKQGEYLGKIANKYNVSVSNIQKWNNLRGTNLRIGQTLVIYPSGQQLAVTKPAAQEKKEIKVETEGETVYYQIQPGDTLWDIAKSRGISVDELKQLNSNLNYKDLKPGMKIVVGSNS